LVPKFDRYFRYRCETRLLRVLPARNAMPSQIEFEFTTVISFDSCRVVMYGQFHRITRIKAGCLTFDLEDILVSCVRTLFKACSTSGLVSPYSDSCRVVMHGQLSTGSHGRLGLNDEESADNAVNGVSTSVWSVSVHRYRAWRAECNSLQQLAARSSSGSLCSQVQSVRWTSAGCAYSANALCSSHSVRAIIDAAHEAKARPRGPVLHRQAPEGPAGRTVRSQSIQPA
jgi:hypothetical protein